MINPTLTANDLLKLALKEAPTDRVARVRWYDANKHTDPRLRAAIRMGGEAQAYTVVATAVTRWSGSAELL